MDLAADTSTLETDQEDVSLSSRKNRKRKSSSSDSEEETVARKKSVQQTSRKLVESAIQLPDQPQSLQTPESLQMEMLTPEIQSKLTFSVIVACRA